MLSSGLCDANVQLGPRFLPPCLYSLVRCCRPEIRASSRFHGYMAQQLPACVHPNSKVGSRQK